MTYCTSEQKHANIIASIILYNMHNKAKIGEAHPPEVRFILIL